MQQTLETWKSDFQHDRFKVDDGGLILRRCLRIELFMSYEISMECCKIISFTDITWVAKLLEGIFFCDFKNLFLVETSNGISKDHTSESPELRNLKRTTIKSVCHQYSSFFFPICDQYPSSVTCQNCGAPSKKKK